MKKWWWLVVSVCLLAACGEEPKKQTKAPDWDRLAGADKDKTESQPASKSSPATVSGLPSAGSSSGGVRVKILPEQPTDRGCLRAVVEGSPGRAAYRWAVNGQVLPKHAGETLCCDAFQRDDQVSVQVGTNDVGASTMVTIGNEPPEVVEVKVSLNKALQQCDISATVQGNDIDGDTVEFRYQWVLNGEADSLLTDSVLSAESYTRGDSIELVVTPYDGLDEGVPYRRSIDLPVAPPKITSQPSQNFKALEYHYQVVATSAETGALAYRLELAPDGMIIDAETGLVSWPLTGVVPGQYNVVIVVADSAGTETAQEFTLDLGQAE